MGVPDQAARERLWEALADLFLDTETRWYLPYAARVAVEEGFSWDHVSNILSQELAPVCGPNLSSVAGEWAGFDRDWLLGSLRRAQSEAARGQAVASHLNATLSPAKLRALRTLFSYLTGFAADQRLPEVIRLDALARMAMEPDWRSCLSFWSQVRVLSTYPAELCQNSFRDGIIPAYEPLLIYQGDATPHQMKSNWTRVSKLLDWIRRQPEGPATIVKVLEKRHRGEKSWQSLETLWSHDSDR